MKTVKFSDAQIIKILQAYEQGESARDLGRKNGFYYQTLYEWKKRYSGITQVSEVQRIRELELENEKLKNYATPHP